MKKLCLLLMILTVMGCSKARQPITIDYKFTSSVSGDYLINYYDPTVGHGVSISINDTSWTKEIVYDPPSNVNLWVGAVVAVSPASSRTCSLEISVNGVPKDSQTATLNSDYNTLQSAYTYIH